MKLVLNIPKELVESSDGDLVIDIRLTSDTNRVDGVNNNSVDPNFLITDEPKSIAAPISPKTNGTISFQELNTFIDK